MNGLQDDESILAPHFSKFSKFKYRYFAGNSRHVGKYFVHIQKAALASSLLELGTAVTVAIAALRI